jgi:site-specific DNA-methyltransferase (adenine-specific)
MTEKVALAFRDRNPDVLTSIANLSNDEVFTPPQFANLMLDQIAVAWAKANNGENIWSNSSVKFLDPFTKSGVFLREITQRLTDGLESEIPDLQTRVDHITSKQVFGIAITQLTSLLARRSVYCSRKANGKHSVTRAFEHEDGNIWFEHLQHTWEGGKKNIAKGIQEIVPVAQTLDGKCKFCGANQKDYDRDSAESYAYPFLHTENPASFVQEKFGAKVKFDVVIGNPPYQLGQSGGESVGGFAMPIYQKFVESAKQLDPHFIVMVTPSRWFAGGRGLDEFRNRMLNDRRLVELVDYPNSADVFPGLDIKGGVSFFLWDSSHNGPCVVRTVINGVSGGSASRFLNEYDVLVRRNEAISILEKVLGCAKAEGLGFASEDVSPIQPFSLRTTFRGKPTSEGLSNPVLLYQNGGIGFLERSEVPRNESWIDEWKVLLSSASGSGNDTQVISKPIVAAPGSACTETYLVVGRFSNELDATIFAGYLRTRFVRFLISLRKYTQHLYSERLAFVPKIPLTKHWEESDLYEKFAITPDEVAFMESIVAPMEDENAG